MPEPSITVIGNKASEQGALDQGADFEAINHSELPPMPEPVTVRVERGEHEVTLIPEKPFSGEPELVEGPSAIIQAQIMDDHEMVPSPPTQKELVGQLQVAIQSAARLLEISKRNPREALCWVRLEGMKQDITCTGDRIVVKQDTMESVYTCRTCKGAGHLKDNCIFCGGKGGDCPHCKCMAWGSEIAYSSGYLQCGDCRGNGWARGIIIPDVAMSTPVTGIVMSVGPDCVLLKLGDRVMFSRYAGAHLTTRKDTIITMRETEVSNLLREAK
jgi:co-chaperonin GroES (HSP10)